MKKTTKMATRKRDLPMPWDVIQALFKQIDLLDQQKQVLQAELRKWFKVARSQ